MPATVQTTTTPEATSEQATATPELMTTPEPCLCAGCLEKGNAIDQCTSFGLNCDCIQSSTTPMLATVQTTTTPKATSEQATTTPELTTTPEPCFCARCLEKGNAVDQCTSFGLNCDCIQASTTPMRLVQPQL